MNDLVPRGANRRTTSRRRATPRSHRCRPPQVGQCARCLSPVGRYYRYCAWCGLRLESPRKTETEIQRRCVTVLFVDIAGFTELSAQLEPEALRAVQTEYFRCVADVIRRWGGVVEKYIGDAVMAVFGASGLDRRHALRAVRAGMQIVAALRRRRFPHAHSLRVRVGVATGEAVVDLGASDGGQGLVTGNVVNVAFRVQSHATVGTVAVTDVTRRATGSVLSYRRLASVSVAGRPEPVELWRPDSAAGPPPCPSASARRPVPPWRRRHALRPAEPRTDRSGTDCRTDGARRMVLVKTTDSTGARQRGAVPASPSRAARCEARTWPAGRCEAHT